jgi:hypothetical protein
LRAITLSIRSSSAMRFFSASTLIENNRHFRVKLTSSPRQAKVPRAIDTLHYAGSSNPCNADCPRCPHEQGVVEVG